MPRGRKPKNSEEKEEKSYSAVPEADEIIKRLVEKYPEVLWAVNPAEVAVFGVDNATRPSSSTTLAKIRVVTPLYQTLLAKYGVTVKYIIELFWADWHEWDMAQRSWILFHECVHIFGENKKLRKHDVEDFALAVDVIGVSGYGPNMPNLLGETPVKFNKDILMRMHKEVSDEPTDLQDAPTPPE